MNAIDRLAVGDEIVVDGQPRRVVVLDVHRYGRDQRFVDRALAQVVPAPPGNLLGWVNLLHGGWALPGERP